MHNNRLRITRVFAFLFLAFCFLSVSLYYIAGDQFKYRNIQINSAQALEPIGLIKKGVSIKQSFISSMDTIEKVSLQIGTYQRKNPGYLQVELKELESQKVVFAEKIDVSTLVDNSFADLRILDEEGNRKGKTFELTVDGEGLDENNAVTIYYNKSANTLKGTLSVNGIINDGQLCMQINGFESLWFGKNYAQIMIAFGILMFIYVSILYWKNKSGKKSVSLSAMRAFVQYRFLLGQLISRDFKTKYKRSFLGVFWSFLNPLLSMSVQYLVFSTIFKSDIANFAVYLLIGIVFFSFFNESTSIGLSSIVDNTSLLTKVYIPKYIFPFSRVFSSSINFLLSLVPLLLVVLFTQTKITWAFLLLPYPIICVLIFCIGMCMLLASLMVFFRDTQFLWSVVNMLWMYMTPIFYPETILSNQLAAVLKLNPLYHFIKFSRTVILQGVSPEPRVYLFCLLSALIPFLIGAVVFKKTQNKFILYI